MIRSVPLLNPLPLLALLAACGAPEPKDPPGGGDPTAPTDETTPDTTSEPPTDTAPDPTDTGTPPVTGRPYLALSAGEELTCALYDDGEVGCQGSTRWSVPAAPPGPFVAVAAGWDTACAIRDTGEIACWGCDWLSSLCDAPAGDRWVALDTADSWFCAQDQDGKVDCWGVTYGEPDRDEAYTEFAVGVTGFVGIRASDGGVDTSAESGDLDGTFVEVAAGRSATCGIRPDGTTACVWLEVPQPPDGLTRIDGYDRDFCWLDGAGHAGCARNAPEAARDGFDPATEVFASITAGKDHACAVTVDGRGYCWPRDGRAETTGIPELH